MSCIRSLWINNPSLRTVGVRSFATGSGGDSRDGKKAKPLSSLMSALEGVKIDGARRKPKIGFSAAAAFKKRKVERMTKPTVNEDALKIKESQEDEKIQQAVQDVAKVFPEQKRTQSELLEQLMRVKNAQEEPENISDVLSGIKVQKGDLSESVESDHEKRGSHISFNTSSSGMKTSLRDMGSPDTIGQEQVQRSQQQRSQDNEKIQQAAQDVAKVFPEQKRTQSELLEQLMRVKNAQEEPEKISDVLSGIKVQKGHLSESLEGAYGKRGSRISFDTSFSGMKTSLGDMGSPDTIGQEQVQRSHHQRKSIFSQRLNIFKGLQDMPKGDLESSSEQRPSVWDMEAEREKKKILIETTRNGFEEMIRLTEEGKLWTYPIDNEKGLEEEQKVPFHEHVFLEEHLEGFPDIAEVMSFMELVLIGLSKNPYLTVEQKKEHIQWFRIYFENKMDVLKETTSAAS